MPAAAAHARHQRAPPFIEPAGYARHRLETTLLYQLVEQHYPAFREMRATAGRSLPDYIEEEIDAYLKCGRLEEGFLRLRCEHCHAEKLVAFSCEKRGFCPSCGARRMAETAALLTDEVYRRYRCRHADPALRFGTEPECALSHDLSGWCVSAGRRSACIPPCVCTKECTAAGVGAADR